MKPVDIVILLIVAAVLGLSVWFIYKSKKAGKKCIGCPHSDTCTGGCGCNEK